MRPPRLRPVTVLPALLLVAAAAAGCGGGSEPADPVGAAPTSSTTPSSTTPSPTATSDEPEEEQAGDDLVPGAGADVDPADVEEWCGAVTLEQLSALTGYEVTEVRSRDFGLQSCVADLSGSELVITWGSEPTTRSFEKYAAQFDRPAGVYDPSVVTLDGGQRIVLAPRPESSTAFVGTVVDGRATQVVIAGLVVRDTDSDVLADMARRLLAVYLA